MLEQRLNHTIKQTIKYGQMEGERKLPEELELTFQIMKTDYTKAIEMLKDQKEMIKTLPKGKERNFLQREYDDYKYMIEHQIEFKLGLMKQWELQGDPVNYVFSEELMAIAYERLNNLRFEDESDNIPNAH
jgi:hypothetical protein